MKIYGIVNGVFYILYGLFGLIHPARIADAMGWTPNLLGLHEVRGIWTALIGIGIVCILVALKGSLRELTKAIVFLTLCFMVGRFIGLVIDGTGPQLTYIEIGIEIVWSGIGLLLLKASSAKSEQGI
jgi:hypothetical protein